MNAEAGIASVRLPISLVFEWTEQTEWNGWVGAAVDAGVFDVSAAVVHRENLEPLSDAARSPYDWHWWATITLPVASTADTSEPDFVTYVHLEGVARDAEEGMRFAAKAMRSAWAGVRTLCDGVS